MIANPDRIAGMKWHEKLAKLLDRSDLSQGKIGIMVGVTQSQMSRWVGGQGGPRPDQIARLAKALRVSCDYLCDEEIASPDQAPKPDDGRMTLLLTLIADMGPDEARRRLLLLPPSSPMEGGERRNPPPPADNGGVQGVLSRRAAKVKGPKGPS